MNEAAKLVKDYIEKKPSASPHDIINVLKIFAVKHCSPANDNQPSEDDILILSTLFDLCSENQHLKRELTKVNTGLGLEEALRRAAEQDCQQWKFLANTDSLTNIYNSRGGMSALLSKEELRNPELQGQHSILFIDLDDFGKINKRHGDHVGDTALQAVAKTITNSLRDSDICFRKGGDEFIIVLSSEDLETTNRAVINRLTKALDGEIEITNDAEEKISIKGSIGIFEYQTKLSPEDNIKLADAEMIKKKMERKTQKIMQAGAQIQHGITLDNAPKV